MSASRQPTDRDRGATAAPPAVVVVAPSVRSEAAGRGGRGTGAGRGRGRARGLPDLVPVTQQQPPPQPQPVPGEPVAAAQRQPARRRRNGQQQRRQQDNAPQRPDGQPDRQPPAPAAPTAAPPPGAQTWPPPQQWSGVHPQQVMYQYATRAPSYAYQPASSYPQLPPPPPTTTTAAYQPSQPCHCDPTALAPPPRPQQQQQHRSAPSQAQCRPAVGQPTTGPAQPPGLPPPPPPPPPGHLAPHGWTMPPPWVTGRWVTPGAPQMASPAHHAQPPPTQRAPTLPPSTTVQPRMPGPPVTGPAFVAPQSGSAFTAPRTGPPFTAPQPSPATAVATQMSPLHHIYLDVWRCYLSTAQPTPPGPAMSGSFHRPPAGIPAAQRPALPCAVRECPRSQQPVFVNPTSQRSVPQRPAPQTTAPAHPGFQRPSVIPQASMQAARRPTASASAMLLRPTAHHPIPQRPIVLHSAPRPSVASLSTPPPVRQFSPARQQSALLSPSVSASDPVPRLQGRDLSQTWPPPSVRQNTATAEMQRLAVARTLRERDELLDKLKELSAPEELFPSGDEVQAFVEARGLDRRMDRKSPVFLVEVWQFINGRLHDLYLRLAAEKARESGRSPVLTETTRSPGASAQVEGSTQQAGSPDKVRDPTAAAKAQERSAVIVSPQARQETTYSGREHGSTSAPVKTPSSTSYHSTPPPMQRTGQGVPDAPPGRQRSSPPLPPPPLPPPYPAPSSLPTSRSAPVLSSSASAPFPPQLPMLPPPPPPGPPPSTPENSRRRRADGFVDTPRPTWPPPGDRGSADRTRHPPDAGGSPERLTGAPSRTGWTRNREDHGGVDGVQEGRAQAPSKVKKRGGNAYQDVRLQDMQDMQLTMKTGTENANKRKEGNIPAARLQNEDAKLHNEEARNNQKKQINVCAIPYDMSSDLEATSHESDNRSVMVYRVLLPNKEELQPPAGSDSANSRPSSVPALTDQEVVGNGTPPSLGTPAENATEGILDSFGSSTTTRREEIRPLDPTLHSEVSEGQVSSQVPRPLTVQDREHPLNIVSRQIGPASGPHEVTSAVINARPTSQSRQSNSTVTKDDHNSGNSENSPSSASEMSGNAATDSIKSSPPHSRANMNQVSSAVSTASSQTTPATTTVVTEEPIPASSEEDCAGTSNGREVAAPPSDRACRDAVDAALDLVSVQLSTQPGRDADAIESVTALELASGVINALESASGADFIERFYLYHFLSVYRSERLGGTSSAQSTSRSGGRSRLRGEDRPLDLSRGSCRWLSGETPEGDHQKEQTNTTTSASAMSNGQPADEETGRDAGTKQASQAEGREKRRRESSEGLNLTSRSATNVDKTEGGAFQHRQGRPERPEENRPAEGLQERPVNGWRSGWRQEVDHEEIIIPLRPSQARMNLLQSNNMLDDNGGLVQQNGSPDQPLAVNGTSWINGAAAYRCNGTSDSATSQELVRRFADAGTRPESGAGRTEKLPVRDKRKPKLLHIPPEISTRSQPDEEHDDQDDNSLHPGDHLELQNGSKGPPNPPAPPGRAAVSAEFGWRQLPSEDDDGTIEVRNRTRNNPMTGGRSATRQDALLDARSDGRSDPRSETPITPITPFSDSSYSVWLSEDSLPAEEQSVFARKAERAAAEEMAVQTQLQQAFAVNRDSTGRFDGRDGEVTDRRMQQLSGDSGCHEGERGASRADRDSPRDDNRTDCRDDGERRTEDAAACEDSHVVQVNTQPLGADAAIPEVQPRYVSIESPVISPLAITYSPRGDASTSPGTAQDAAATTPSRRAQARRADQNRRRAMAAEIQDRNAWQAMAALSEEPLGMMRAGRSELLGRVFEEMARRRITRITADRNGEESGQEETARTDSGSADLRVAEHTRQVDRRGSTEDGGSEQRVDSPDEHRHIYVRHIGSEPCSTDDDQPVQESSSATTTRPISATPAFHRVSTDDESRFTPSPCPPTQRVGPRRAHTGRAQSRDFPLPTLPPADLPVPKPPLHAPRAPPCAGLPPPTEDPYLMRRTRLFWSAVQGTPGRALPAHLIGGSVADMRAEVMRYHLMSSGLSVGSERPTSATGVSLVGTGPRAEDAAEDASLEDESGEDRRRLVESGDEPGYEGDGSLVSQTMPAPRHESSQSSSSASRLQLQQIQPPESQRQQPPAQALLPVPTRSAFRNRFSGQLHRVVWPVRGPPAAALDLRRPRRQPVPPQHTEAARTAEERVTSPARPPPVVRRPRPSPTPPPEGEQDGPMDLSRRGGR